MDGQRVRRTNGSTIYTYYYTGGNLRYMTVGTAKLFFIMDPYGQPTELYYNSGSSDAYYYYYVRNIQGDIIALLDKTGNTVVEYTYDAWGKPLSISGTMADTLGALNPLRYRGYFYDSEIGLYYLQSRYYDPEMGRFINADEFASTGQSLLGNNMFAYCANNPVSREDDSGHLWITVATLGIGTLGSVASSAIAAKITGQKFTVGDAVGAAIDGFAATAMSLIGIPPIIANPVATFCGETLGKMIDNDTSAEAAYEIRDNVFKSIGTTVFFSGAGKLISKYVEKFIDYKYVNLKYVDQFIKKITYKPKYMNEKSFGYILGFCSDTLR